MRLVAGRVRSAAALLLLLVAAAGGAAAQQLPETGSIIGRVVDESGAAAEGVTVTVTWPAAEGAEPRQETRASDAEGAFELRSVPPGRYAIRFAKPGYRESTLHDFEVAAGRAHRADVTLSPAAPETAVPREPDLDDVEEFVVIASPVEEILAASRMDADELINTLGAAEFDKLAIGDVAEALKYVAGVNVVEGQFAVIRGLEDRYSSTLYNFGVVPSPDPDRQSVQLDLFPSDIVNDLVVAKTFGPDLPSNSSGGSINVLTQQYPEEFTFKLGAGSGFNANASDRFVEIKDGSAVGTELDSSDVLESDFSASLGGRGSLLERELRFKALVASEIDYETKEGYQEGLEPQRAASGQSGGLSLGELSLSDGRFDLTESERSEQKTGYAGFGLNFDEAGDHRIDSSFFYSRREEEIGQLRENGYFPGFDYDTLVQKQLAGSDVVRGDFGGSATLRSWIAGVRANADESPIRGPLWFDNFSQHSNFRRDRDLWVGQLVGEHRVGAIEGLQLSWAGNYAETSQDEEARGMRSFLEPLDPTQFPTEFPSTPESIGEGFYGVNDEIFFSSNDIAEDQRFGRLDADYEFEPFEPVRMTLSTGVWYEDAARDVSSSYLALPTVGRTSQYAVNRVTAEELGRDIFDVIDRSPDGTYSGLRENENDSSREIMAWNLRSKAVLWEQVDLLAGFRLESIRIESNNDPFTGGNVFDGSPGIFPSKYLFFDRLDNAARGEGPIPPSGTPWNDEILGIDVPIDAATGLVDLADEDDIAGLINGEIDETLLLPSLGLTWRPLEGLSLRAAWSQTTARPSFREMGYYVSVEPATDDLVVGNPQLQLSDVESWDARLEYAWGDLGDLAAVSVFYKTIQDPIESIVVRNPINLEGSSASLFRTFFNNPSEATLTGFELEARKHLDFFGPQFLEYFSIGGNFTYIDAEVDRTAAELARSTAFFGVLPGEKERFSKLEESRRLFGQPEWIANVDLGFEHPDWGTKVTLAFFAISDVLDAAGSASLGPSGSVDAFTLDRYVDSFHQLDVIASQTWRADFLRGDFTLKLSIKNLTDSERAIVYDREQTRSEFTERSYKVGRDFSLSLTYTF
jgi:TonB-dependent receptor